MRNPGVGLTAEAGNNIFVNNTITTNQGGINLIAGRGGIGINSNIRSRGGDIFLKAGSDINVNRGVEVGTDNPRANSGDLRIETTGRLILQDSQVSAATVGSGNAGNVTVIASEIQLNASEGFAPVDTLIDAQSTQSATGNAGKITIQTGRLIARNGGQVIAGIKGSAGNAGEIEVTAGEIELIGEKDGLPSGFFANSVSGSTGNSGKITIQTGRLIARDGGGVLVGTSNDKNAGELVIRAGEIELSGTGSRLNASAFPPATGGGGRVDIVTERLLVQNGATIRTSAPIGNGGNLNITATDSVKVVNNASINASSFRGTGGNISLNTRNLTVDEGSGVDTVSFGQGNAGNITVRSSESVTVGNRSTIGTISFGSGTGGDIDIETGVLTIRGDLAGVTTSSAGQGNAGNLRVAADSVNVTTNGILSTGTLGVGAGGNLLIDTRNLNILDGGKVSTSSLDAKTFDFSPFDNIFPPSAVALVRNIVNEASQGNFTQGSSGNLTVRATESVTVGGNNSVLATQARGRASGGTLNIETGRATIQDAGAVSSATFGEGVGGDVRLRANSLSLINRGLLTSRSEQSGDAGNILVNLNNNLQSNGGLVEATSIRAGGGNVNINAEDILLRNSSLIATSVFDSTGGGGNINIQGTTFVAVEDSDILANAEAGPGGDITINSPAFLAQLFDGRQAEAVGRNPGAFQRFRGNGRVDISAESRTGTSGTVDLPNIDESIGLPELPSDLTDATRQIDQRCSPGSPIATGQSSFTITGTGGVPPSPTDMLRNNLILDNEATDASQTDETDKLSGSLTDNLSVSSVTESGAASASSATPSAAEIIEAQGWIIDKNGDIILTAEPTTLAPRSSFAIAPPCTVSSINK